jgi:aminopeptidase N
LELEIQSAIVEQSGNTSNSTISYDIQNEYAIFQLAQKITEGSAVLKLEFTGELNDKLVGFYRSKYELNGETRYMATTQFAPTDARKAFPWYISLLY